MKIKRSLRMEGITMQRFLSTLAPLLIGYMVLAQPVSSPDVLPHQEVTASSVASHSPSSNRAKPVAHSTYWKIRTSGQKWLLSGLALLGCCVACVLLHKEYRDAQEGRGKKPLRSNERTAITNEDGSSDVRKTVVVKVSTAVSHEMDVNDSSSVTSLPPKTKSELEVREASIIVGVIGLNQRSSGSNKRIDGSSKQDSKQDVVKHGNLKASSQTRTFARGISDETTRGHVPSSFSKKQRLQMVSNHLAGEKSEIAPGWKGLLRFLRLDENQELIVARLSSGCIVADAIAEKIVKDKTVTFEEAFDCLVLIEGAGYYLPDQLVEDLNACLLTHRERLGKILDANGEKMKKVETWLAAPHYKQLVAFLCKRMNRYFLWLNVSGRQITLAEIIADKMVNDQTMTFEETFGFLALIEETSCHLSSTLAPYIKEVNRSLLIPTNRKRLGKILDANGKKMKKVEAWLAGSSYKQLVAFLCDRANRYFLWLDVTGRQITLAEVIADKMVNDQAMTLEEAFDCLVLIEEAGCYLPDQLVKDINGFLLTNREHLRDVTFLFDRHRKKMKRVEAWLANANFNPLFLFIVKRCNRYLLWFNVTDGSTILAEAIADKIVEEKTMTFELAFACLVLMEKAGGYVPDQLVKYINHLLLTNKENPGKLKRCFDGHKRIKAKMRDAKIWLEDANYKRLFAFLFKRHHRYFLWLNVADGKTTLAQAIADKIVKDKNVAFEAAFDCLVLMEKAGGCVPDKFVQYINNMLLTTEENRGTLKRFFSGNERINTNIWRVKIWLEEANFEPLFLLLCEDYNRYLLWLSVTDGETTLAEAIAHVLVNQEVKDKQAHRTFSMLLKRVGYVLDNRKTTGQQST